MPSGPYQHSHQLVCGSGAGLSPNALVAPKIPLCESGGCLPVPVPESLSQSQGLCHHHSPRVCVCVPVPESVSLSQALCHHSSPRVCVPIPVPESVSQSQGLCPHPSPRVCVPIPVPGSVSQSLYQALCPSPRVCVTNPKVSVPVPVPTPWIINAPFLSLFPASFPSFTLYISGVPCPQHPTAYAAPPPSFPAAPTGALSGVRPLVSLHLLKPCRK